MEREEGCGIFMRTAISCSFSGDILGPFSGYSRPGGGGGIRDVYFLEKFFIFPRSSVCLLGKWWNLYSLLVSLYWLESRFSTNSVWTKKLNFTLDKIVCYFVLTTENFSFPFIYLFRQVGFFKNHFSLKLKGKRFC